jgi:hypothetical protein
VEEPSKTVAADHRARATQRSWNRRPLLQALMRSGFMIVIEELAKDVVKVATAEDQVMIQQLAAGRTNPTFSERVGARGAVW